MNIKKILFAVMCTLIVLTVVMAGIVIGQVMNMFQGLLSAPPPSATTQETTIPTESPTEEPTEPPTTLPTEPIHEHAFTKKHKVEDPTCINRGYTIYKCECGETDEDDFVDPLGHEYGPGEEVTFCLENGYTQYKCIRCSYVQKKGKLDPVGHSFTTEKERVDATCKASGYVVMGCSGIDCSEKQQLELPITNHIFSKEIEKVINCTTPGRVIYQCAFEGCEETKQTELPATGHQFGSWNGDANACANGCGVALQAADMKITKEECTGTDSKHYYIEVGTDAVPKLYSYVVEDHRENADTDRPTFAYVHGQGLSVTFTDGTGSHTEYLDDGEILDISADEET